MRPLPILLLILLFGLAAPGQGQSYPEPLTEAQAAELASLFDDLKGDPRGPYRRIRWHCADGTDFPPGGGRNPCNNGHGGGIQYADLKLEVERLDELGFHPGTLLAARSFEELFDADRGHAWLRELVLQRFLVQVDDGWVLRRARTYRGARQIEDEEERGQAYLTRLLGDPEWTSSHYLLALRLVGILPHARSSDGQITERMRNLATAVARADDRFFPTRVRIHSFPSAADLEAVRDFLDRRDLSAQVRSQAEDLEEVLETLYDPKALPRLLESVRGDLPADIGRIVDRRSGDLSSSSPDRVLAGAAELMVGIRDHITSSTDGATNLRLADFALELEQQARVRAMERASSSPESRRAGIRRVVEAIDMAYGAGFLSGREREALHDRSAELTSANAMQALEYRNEVAYLARSLEWGWGTARAHFAPIQARYAQVEPKATGFIDAIVRDSPLLPLGAELDRLLADAAAALDAADIVLGRSSLAGVRGLNPGVAYRPLYLASGPDAGSQVTPEGIYVIPATTPELEPLAGVLTLDEGNLLSHVQLLARNLGIPNAVIPSSLTPSLEAIEGQPVLYAVSPLGRVILERPDRIPPEARPLVESSRDEPPARVNLDTSRLRLDEWRPIPLEDLRASDSGVRVGPKAANLGELRYNFPDRVSNAAALPFGLFVRHVDRPVEPGEPTVLEVIRRTAQIITDMRASGASEDRIDAEVVQRLDRIRHDIEALPWEPAVEQAIRDIVTRAFGTPSVGVFVRSDTNVEDLPQFSGAGLNLTVPNRRSMESILEAVKQVWTSPFTERAYLWRKQVLEAQGEVYPSVLLQQAVPSEKSGVLITTGIQGGDADDVTVVIAEGVGGAVDGEQAETVLLHPDGSSTLLSQAKSPQKRIVVQQGGGGVEWRVADLPDTLVTSSEMAQLRGVVAKWKGLLRQAGEEGAWDMEIGFVDGQLRLFQTRPFVQFRDSGVLERLQALDRQALANGARRLSLDDPPRTPVSREENDR